MIVMNNLTAPPVLFLDLDGTVRHGKDELGHFVNKASDVVIFPEAVTAIRAWQEAGGVAIGVTNQGGVALGHITRDDHMEIIDETGCGAGLDHILACPHDPSRPTCWCRKPLPGLIFGALEWVADVFDALPTRDVCLMVGDRTEDRLTADVCGLQFEWAIDWREKAREKT